MNTVLFRIRTLMAQQHITQKRLADSLQVSYSSLNNYLNGRRWPNLMLLRDIAYYLNTSSDYLLGLTEQPHPTPFTEDEKLLLQLYRALPPEAKTHTLHELRRFVHLCHQLRH